MARELHLSRAELLKFVECELSYEDNLRRKLTEGTRDRSTLRTYLRPVPAATRGGPQASAAGYIPAGELL